MRGVDTENSLGPEFPPDRQRPARFVIEKRVPTFVDELHEDPRGAKVG